jgi:hypothetical protein
MLATPNSPARLSDSRKGLLGGWPTFDLSYGTTTPAAPAFVLFVKGGHDAVVGYFEFHPLAFLWHTGLMPKRLSKDINQAAFQMVHRSTGTDDRPTKVSQSDISRVMAAMGRKGGKIGGKRRLTTMTAEQRREIALKAAKTRWNKHRAP